MPERHTPDDADTAADKTRVVQGPIAAPFDARSTTNQSGLPGSPTVGTPAASLPAHVGRFEVRSCLGGGAFGWVYHAFDPELRRDVAIKLPRAERLQTPADRARFLNEARAAATIRHPQVVPVHEVGETDGLPYIVMDYIHGPTLAAMLAARAEPFAPREAAAVVQSLAFAVEAAHVRGVVHRDLKPANILFDNEHRRFMVTDFGLARVHDPGDPRASATGVAGTPAYMPPEQARGDSAAVGRHSDVYALGVILFELMTRQLPFRGSTVADVIAEVLTAAPPPVATLVAGVPPGLDAVCRKAMAKSPADRYSSARELAEALAPFATPAPEPVGRTTGPERSRRAVLLGGLGLTAAAACGVAYRSRNRDGGGQPPAVNPPTAPPDSPAAKAATPPEDRRAAEWALRSGGTIEVADPKTGEVRKPTRVTDLPIAFRLVRIKLKATDASADDAVMKNLTGLTSLRALDFTLGQQLSDVGLAHLVKLPALESLGVMYGDRITDVGVSAFARHPTLREIHLGGTGMSPAGVAALATIPNLEVLSFHGHPITDDWLAAAAKCRGLHQLYCGYSQDRRGAKVTAAGLAHLAPLKELYLIDLDTAAIEPGATRGLPNLPKLNQLFLRKTLTNDDDLLDLERLGKLSILGLHETQVTDAGMRSVAKFAGLKTLYLDGTRVGDEGLRLLTACKELEHLSVEGSRITAAGRREFKAALPNCTIVPPPKG